MPNMTRSNCTAGRHDRVVWWILALLLSALLLAAPAGAQEQPAEPAFSATEVDAIVRTIEDPDQRAKLVEQLKLLKAARETEEAPLPVNGLGAVLLTALSEQIQEVTRGFTAVGRVILALPQAVADLADQAGRPEARQRWLEIAGKLAVVLIGALLAQWAVERLLRRPMRALEARQSESLWVKIPMLVLRALLELLPIAAFAAAAYGVLPLLEPRPATRVVALTVINASLMVRLVRALADLILAPHAPALRLPRIGDETAHYIFIWISRLTAVSVYGYFIAEAALVLGLPRAAHALLLRAIGLFVAGMIVVLILQNRVGVADWLRGRPRRAPSAAVSPQERRSSFGNVRHRVADVWHVLAIVYVAASYGVWALAVPGGFQFLLRATVLTAVVLVLLRTALALLRRAVTRGFALSQDLKRRYPGLEGRANRYLPTFETLLQIVLYVFAALWLLEIWGVDSFDWLESEFGRRLTGSALTVVVVLLLSAILLEITDAFIERYLAPKDSLGRAVVRSARARTLLPLLRNAFRVLLAVMVALIVLSELGVNIAPLLAGAGVVGLAIGFGAQTLVKDVITGFFILAEDTVSIGDVVDIGGAAGVVEAMTIRSIRLRDGNGSVHTIPFSAVTTVKNMTKDFAYAMFKIGVAYDSDTDEVIELMREVATDMSKDEQFGRSMLTGLEVMGLDQFADSALVLMARIKTPPGQQWTISREFNRRLKRLFDERGIEIPFPQRTVHLIAEKPVRVKGGGRAAGAPEGFNEPEEDKADSKDDGGAP
jgi:small conductance mechanosensitive channel